MDETRCPIEHPCWVHFLASLPNLVWQKHSSLGVVVVGEATGLRNAEMPVALQPVEPASMIASASLARALRSIAGEPARTRRTSMGS